MTDSSPPPVTAEQLKPCPFCGSAAVMLTTMLGGTAIICPTQNDCSAHPRIEFATASEAITSWNTRFDTERNATLERQNAALREALKPFVRECEDMGLGPHLTDERLIDEVDDAPSLLTVGDYRRARNAHGGQS